MAKRDYYDVLGLSRSATAEEIKKAHRKLVRQYHPDVNKDNKAAEEKFKEAQEAYDVLSEPDKRRSYDQFGHAGVGAGGPAGGPGNGDAWESFRRAGGGRRAGRRGEPGVGVEDFEPGDFSNSGDFSDIFEQLFGNRGGGGGGRTQPRGRPRPAPSPERGADIEHPISLTFEQAARGVTLPLQITRDGKIETIDVKIPPGVKDGSRVRIRGRGQHVTGADPGDLYIVTSVLPHEYFRRDDLNVLLDVPLSLYEAMLGTKVTVPTLDGPVTITVPPGTNSGTKLRVKGRGIERGGEKGDQYSVVKIVVPKTLDDAGKKLVEQLQAEHPVDPRADLKW